MSKWVSEPLGQLVTFKKGKKVSTSPFMKPGYVRYLGAGSLVGNDDGYASTHLAVQANDNDVLMLWDGERSGLVGHKLSGVVSSTVSKLTPNHKASAELLYYTLSNNFEWIQNRRTGTGIPHVPKDLGRILSISYPKDKKNQDKITSVLAAIDQTIEKTEALIEKYQQIKSGLMHDLFSRGITDDGKLRPAKEQTPELYQETPIGWIPKEWELSNLKEKAKPGIPHLRTGPFGSALKGEHWAEEGTPVITIGALGEGKFTLPELLYVGEFDAKRLSEFKLKVGDVVFSRVADVGRSVVVREAQIGWIMSSNLMRISLDREQVLPDFFQYQLAGDARIKKQIRCKVNSGGRDVANSEILNRLLFAFPDFDEQTAIVERVNAIDSRIFNEKSKVEKLSTQKCGLMHDLLTGKVPVNIEVPEAAHV